MYIKGARALPWVIIKSPDNAKKNIIIGNNQNFLCCLANSQSSLINSIIVKMSNQSELKFAF